MKYLFCLILIGCVDQTRIFAVSDDILPQDREWLKEAVKNINEHVGCDKISLEFNWGVFTPKDIGRGKDFIAFNNQKETHEYLLNENKEEKEFLFGLTAINSLSNEADMFLFSFTAYRWPLFCPLGDDCKQSEKLNPNPLLSEFIITHEMGHSLGLEHTKNPQDIMYASIETQWENGITNDQWKNYILQLKEVGVQCPKK